VSNFSVISVADDESVVATKTAASGVSRNNAPHAWNMRARKGGVSAILQVGAWRRGTCTKKRVKKR
jgi:hypothetical protein